MNTPPTQSKETGQWISVKDTLPETGYHVLLETDEGIVIGYYDEEFYDMREALSSTVTHWMPLPNPPGADEQSTPAETAAELKELKSLLQNPTAVRVNILRGTIKKPDDLVWLHDEHGPVADLRGKITALTEEMTLLKALERYIRAVGVRLPYGSVILALDDLDKYRETKKEKK